MMATKRPAAAKKPAPKRATTVRLSAEHETRLAALADEMGTTRSAIIQIALARYLRNPGK